MNRINPHFRSISSVLTGFLVTLALSFLADRLVGSAMANFGSSETVKIGLVLQLLLCLCIFSGLMGGYFSAYLAQRSLVWHGVAAAVVTFVGMRILSSILRSPVGVPSMPWILDLMPHIAISSAILIGALLRDWQLLRSSSGPIPDLTGKGVLLRSAAKPATTPLVEQARMRGKV